MNNKVTISKLVVYKDEQGDVSSIDTALLVVPEKKGKYFFVYSPDLRVYGKSLLSEDDASENFEDAVGRFLNIHIQRGTLESTLSNFHWNKESDASNSFTGAKRFNPDLYANTKVAKQQVAVA